MHSPANTNYPMDRESHEAWGRTFNMMLEVAELIEAAQRKQDAVKLQLISAWGRVCHA